MRSGDQQPAGIESNMSVSLTMDCPAAIGTEIQECMEQFLKSRMPTVSREVECKFKEGMLLIRGKVVSYYAKQLAQEYARQLPGVEHVANHLTVEKAA